MDTSPHGDPYAFFGELRRAASWRKGDAVFLAEANVPPIEAPLYFEQGNAMHMPVNFWLNQQLVSGTRPRYGRAVAQRTVGASAAIAGVCMG
jgi:hypothetical protein